MVNRQQMWRFIADALIASARILGIDDGSYSSIRRRRRTKSGIQQRLNEADFLSSMGGYIYQQGIIEGDDDDANVW